MRFSDERSIRPPAGLGIAVGLLGLAPFGTLAILPRVAIFVFFGGLGGLVLRGARRRVTTLELSAGGLSWHRPGARISVAREAARRVFIARSRWPLKDPTDYLLEIDLDGRRSLESPSRTPEQSRHAGPVVPFGGGLRPAENGCSCFPSSSSWRQSPPPWCCCGPRAEVRRAILKTSCRPAYPCPPIRNDSF